MLVLGSTSRCGPANLMMKVNVIRSDFPVGEPGQFSPAEKVARLIPFIF
jgi:hypothetical protein